MQSAAFVRDLCRHGAVFVFFDRDREACVKLETACGIIKAVRVDHPQKIQPAVARPFLIEAGGVPVGFAMLAVDPDNEDPEDCW